MTNRIWAAYSSFVQSHKVPERLENLWASGTIVLLNMKRLWMITMRRLSDPNMTENVTNKIYRRIPSRSVQGSICSSSLLMSLGVFLIMLLALVRQHQAVLHHHLRRNLVLEGGTYYYPDERLDFVVAEFMPHLNEIDATEAQLRSRISLEPFVPRLMETPETNETRLAMDTFWEHYGSTETGWMDLENILLQQHSSTDPIDELRTLARTMMGGRELVCGTPHVEDSMAPLLANDEYCFWNGDLVSTQALQNFRFERSLWQWVVQ